MWTALGYLRLLTSAYVYAGTHTSSRLALLIWARLHRVEPSPAVLRDGGLGSLNAEPSNVYGISSALTSLVAHPWEQPGKAMFPGPPESRPPSHDLTGHQTIYSMFR
jgi:hypothetical protein